MLLKHLMKSAQLCHIQESCQEHIVRLNKMVTCQLSQTTQFKQVTQCKTRKQQNRLWKSNQLNANP